jgi:beta-phosphoglucomutase-like phosphatase (HAD superfamily)
MNSAKKNNIKLALGTAGTTENIAFNLAEIGIANYFDAVVGKADIIHTKPHPETFLNCASKLSILPEECLVFEDVPKGIETALNAGMKAVAITTTHQKNEFINFNNIVTFIADFNTITPEELI